MTAGFLLLGDYVNPLLAGGRRSAGVAPHLAYDQPEVASDRSGSKT